jgi:protein TonB
MNSAPRTPRSQYQLKSDLAQYCLPPASGDATRLLAWVNSICLLFLIVGIVGLNARPITLPKPTAVEEVIPTVIEPIPQPPTPAEQHVTTEETETQSQRIGIPEVVTVVAPDRSSPAFTFPVTGPVAVGPSVHLATAPPPQSPKRSASPKPTTLIPGSGGGEGQIPAPQVYPPLAQKRREEGTVILHLEVAEDGSLNSVRVKESSGSSILDDFSLSWVKTRWRFNPGQPREFYVPFKYQLNSR